MSSSNNLLKSYLKTLLNGGVVVVEPKPLEDGLALYEAGDHEGALPLLKQALAKQPQHPQVLAALAKIHLDAEHFADAAPFLAIIVRLNPANAQHHFDMGTCFQGQGARDLAAECFRKALKIKPDHAAAQLKLGTILFETRHTDEALTALNRAIYLDRRAVDARFIIAQICMEAGDYQRALTQLHLLKTLKPNHPPIFLTLATIFEHLGDHRQVVQELSKAIALGEVDATLFWRLGRAHLLLANREEALAAFQHAIAHDPTFYTAHHDLARLAEELNRYSLALESYRVLAGVKEYRDQAIPAMDHILEMLAQIANNMAAA